MDEKRDRDRDIDREPDLLMEMERDTEIKRATNVRNALGPSGGDEKERTDESGIATEAGQHSGRSRSGRTSRPQRSDEED